MNVFHMVVWVVAIVMIAGVLDKYLKTRAQKKSDDESNEDADVRIGELEERVRVLERIVTRSNEDLRRKIDEL